MPAAQVIGTKPMKDEEQTKVNDGDFELVTKIRCFAGLAYDAFGEHAYNRQRGNHELSVPLPARRLFYSYDTISSDPTNEDVDVDIDSVEEEVPFVETSVANRLLNECEKLIEIYRPRPVGGDKGDLEDHWDEIIPKSNWSPSQVKSFSTLLKILSYDRLSRLSHASHSSEAILRRITIEKTASRLRTLFTRVSWNVKLAQWLHGVIVDRAPSSVLLSYLEAMQVLYNKIPSLINQVINSSAVSLSSKNLGLDIITQIITKKCWDPVAPMLAQHKMPKLPLAPVFIVLGSEPLDDLPSNSRTHHWISLLTELGTVKPITSLQTERDKNRMKMPAYLDELLYTVRVRIQAARTEFSDVVKRPIILVGINAGGPLMAHTALYEPNNVQGVICVGFSVDTAEGKRGEAKDRLLELTCPTLFIIGQCSTTATEYDMEEIRKRLKCVSGLIVVGGADDQLRKDSLDLTRERVTQDIVDRGVINEVAGFLSKALTMPKRTVVSKSVSSAVTSLVTNAGGVTVVRIKEPRGKKERGESRDGKVKKNYYQEKKRKLAEMLAMGVASECSPTKKQKREVPDKNPKILIVSTAPTILRASSSNTLAKSKRTDISPRKSLDDLPGSSASSTASHVSQITVVAKPIPSSQVRSAPQQVRDETTPAPHPSSLQKMLGSSAGSLRGQSLSSASPLADTAVKLQSGTLIQAASSGLKVAGANPVKTTPARVSSSSETSGIASLQSLLKSHQSVKPVPPSHVKKKPAVTSSVLANVQTSSVTTSSARNIRVIKPPDSGSRTFTLTSLSNVRYITTTSTSTAQLSNINTLVPITSLPSGGPVRSVQVKPSGQLRSMLQAKPSGGGKPHPGTPQTNLLRDLTPIDILGAPIDIIEEESLVEEIEEESVQSSAPTSVKLIRINKAGVNVTSAASLSVVYK